MKLNKESENTQINPYIFAGLSENNPSTILLYISELMGTTSERVRSKSRLQNDVMSRYLYIMIMRLKGSRLANAASFVNRDRTTSIYAMKKIVSWYDTEIHTKKLINKLIDDYKLHKSFEENFRYLHIEFKRGEKKI